MNLQYWILVPPVAFFVVFAAMAAMELASRKLAVRGVPPSEGKTKAYACGEDPSTHRVQPDYSQMFPFAFFFTIMHVVALILATMPNGKVTGIAVLYVLAAISGLFILFRDKIQADLAKLFGQSE